MSKQITLESITDHFRDLLHEVIEIGDFRFGIPDCTVMVNLECTPQSWSRYRPQLIQYCENYNLTKEEVRDGVTIETINITMNYDQKRKKWYGKRNQLRIRDKNLGSFRPMTPEELKQYKIVWYAEDDFMYTHHTH